MGGLVIGYTGGVKITYLLLILMELRHGTLIRPIVHFKLEDWWILRSPWAQTVNCIMVASITGFIVWCGRWSRFIRLAHVSRSPLRDGAWPSYLLEILVSPTGVATSIGEGIYNEGATTLSLVDISWQFFNEWTGEQPVIIPLNIVISSNTSVSASLPLININLPLALVRVGLSAVPVHYHGTTAPILATPNPCYSRVVRSRYCKHEATTTTVSMTDNRTVTANFTP